MCVREREREIENGEKKEWQRESTNDEKRQKKNRRMNVCVCVCVWERERERERERANWKWRQSRKMSYSKSCRLAPENQIVSVQAKYTDVKRDWLFPGAGNPTACVRLTRAGRVRRVFTREQFADMRVGSYDRVYVSTLSFHVYGVFCFYEDCNVCVYVIAFLYAYIYIYIYTHTHIYT